MRRKRFKGLNKTAQSPWRHPDRTTWHGANVRFRKRAKRDLKASTQLVVSGALAGVLLGIGWIYADHLPFSGAVESRPSDVGCASPVVVDGDTLRCPSGRIRLASIDAPELPGHCRAGRECTPGDPYASTEHLRSLIAGNPIECRYVDRDRYGRTVARCTVKGVDLSCAQVSSGHAVRRYGLLIC